MEERESSIQFLGFFVVVVEVLDFTVTSYTVPKVFLTNSFTLLHEHVLAMTCIGEQCHVSAISGKLKA
jgi:hypothetical protein